MLLRVLGTAMTRHDLCVHRRAAVAILILHHLKLLNVL